MNEDHYINGADNEQDQYDLYGQDNSFNYNRGEKVKYTFNDNESHVNGD